MTPDGVAEINALRGEKTGNEHVVGLTNRCTSAYRKAVQCRGIYRGRGGGRRPSDQYGDDVTFVTGS